MSAEEYKQKTPKVAFLSVVLVCARTHVLLLGEQRSHEGLKCRESVSHFCLGTMPFCALCYWHALISSNSDVIIIVEKIFDALVIRKICRPFQDTFVP